MRIPIYKGKKINQILCILFLLASLIMLLVSGILILSDKTAAALALCVPALITGAFSLLYGVLWIIYGHKEKKTGTMLNEIAQQQYLPGDSAAADCWEFILPKDRLAETALRRFHQIVLWTGFAELAVFLLICGLLYLYGSSPHPLNQLSIMLFCLLTAVPGILVQLQLYQKYTASVPSRIRMFPGKLIVDNLCFPAGEIHEIRISPVRSMNQNSPGVFREMLIRTEAHTETYRIDYRSGTMQNGAPCWEEYEAFLSAIVSWGMQNNVQVFISYMS